MHKRCKDRPDYPCLQETETPGMKQTLYIEVGNAKSHTINNISTECVEARGRREKINSSQKGHRSVHGVYDT